MSVLGLSMSPLLFVIVLGLNWVVPGRWVDGYVLDPSTGKPLRYHLNGLRVFVLTIAAWAAACQFNLLEWNALYLYRWEMLTSACVIGLAFSALIVFGSNAPKGANPLTDFYLGRLDNPQLAGGRLDAKMYLYLIGATLLELNVLSFAAHHLLTHRDDPNPGVLLYSALFTFFIVEYLNFEQVHLYTYDFMAEKVGFKLGWGCLVFYPFFYGVGLWFEAAAPNPHRPGWSLVLAGVLFFVGWAFARGANLQKFHFKRDPSYRFLGLDPKPITDGQRSVLSGGFWGLSRHINYLGELLMASALTLSLGFALDFVPWLYPLYYVVLLVPRQYQDDTRCAHKYGALWVEYVKRVPFRIIPYVY